jgi:hypothetical protein
MKNIIKKILREEFPRGGDRKQKETYVRRKLEQLQNIYPHIEKYFETKFGDKVELDGSIRDKHLGNDNLSIQGIHLRVFIKESNSIKAQDIKSEIWSDLQSIFGLDLRSYGEPIDIEFLKIEWKNI